MIRRTLGEIAAMIGANVDENWARIEIAGVSTDSRQVTEGQLYVPLAGERFDGHAFISDAFMKGAAASFWQAGRPNPPENEPLLVVDDPLTALQKLAGAYLKELNPKVIGITGSNGKTTTKDMVASALATVFRVHKTQGNFNNHIGLPLTILALGRDVEIVVLEMGMSGRGEIELLSELAEPDAVIITMIGEAHLLQLGSREEIARAKAEILSGLKNGGLFVYNGDEPLIEQVLPEMKRPAAFKPVRFGKSDTNDYYPTQIRIEGDRTSFSVAGNDIGANGAYTIPLLGEHNVTNALAAIAVAEAFGVPQARIAEGLASMQMTGMRIEKLTAESGLTVLNDAYNASPASMKAAIELLSSLQGYSRKFAVLGDMLELGGLEADFHREIGAMLDPNAIDELYAYGALGRLYAEEAAKRYPQDRVHWFADKAELAAKLEEAAAQQDVVLVKGSRAMRLEEVVQALTGAAAGRH